MNLKNLNRPASNGTLTHLGLRAALAMLPLVVAGAGAGVADPSHTNGEWNANTRIAQAQGYGQFQLCRDIFNRPGEFFPKHPRADQYGCVHPSHLGRGRRQAKPNTFQLRRAGNPTAIRSASEWVPVNNSTNRIFRFFHDFKRAPSVVTIWFSPNRDRKRMYPVTWAGGTNADRNPVSVDLVQNGIRLHIRAKRPIHRTWNARTGKWQKYDSGYWKVVVLQ